MDLEQLLPAVRDIVGTAAARIQEIRGEPVSADLKADQSPVTRADHEADTLLRTHLTELFPAGWLSEETADAPDRLSQRLVWVVDPLDGTKEFIGEIPEYSVAVALVDDGEPILGVVHNPATGEGFWGARDLGAWHQGGQGSPGDPRPITVREGNVILASRSELARGEFEAFVMGKREEGKGRRGQRGKRGQEARLLNPHSSPLTGWEVVGRGSIELKLAQVAAGLGAVTFSRGPKHEWDVCAGALLVEEAGGRVTDLFGEPLRFNRPFPKTKGILAGAPEAFDRALAAIREIGASDRMEEMNVRE